MGFDKYGAVSAFELVIYLPALVVAMIVCSRHGFGRSSGWIYTLILCLIRIIGACCQLATYSSKSTSLIETAIILDSIGLSPLLLATLGVLSRCADSINESSKGGVFSAIHFRALQLLVTISLILCIVGGTSSTSSDGTYKVQSETKIGMILYVVAFIALSVLAVVTKHKLANAPSSENKLAWAALITLPLIFVRLCYSLICDFGHNKHFSILTGSVIIHVFMAIVEEMLVVIIYLAFGWASKVLSPAERGPIANRPWKGNLAGAGTGRNGNGRGRRQGGPIHQLVGAAVDHAQQRQQQRQQGV